jgi:hypothetical protein
MAQQRVLKSFVMEQEFNDIATPRAGLVSVRGGKALGERA